MQRLLILFVLFLPQLVLALDLSSDQIQAIIQRFAPLVKLHHQEEYYPSSVHWYLERSSLKRKHDKKYREVISGPIYDANRLSGYKGPSYSITPFGTPQVRALTFQGEPLDEAGPIRLVRSPCYANLIEISGELAIQYLFFYPYNGRQLGIFDWASHLTGLSFGAHEGDWEHIGVHLKLPESWPQYTLDELTVSRLYYSRHTQNFGIYTSPESAEFEGELPKVEGSSALLGPAPDRTHPVVYSAYHGHASYPHVFTGVNWLFDRTSNSGPRWRCWENVIYIGEPDQPATGQEWIRYGGKWGVDKAPRTPTLQGWWENQ
jgi:hypothetical protein